MEPVPETERLEEFNSNPASSSLRLTNPATVSTIDLDTTRRSAPTVIRRSTDPVPSSPSSPLWSQPVVLPYRPRTTSPLAGAHTRSRSTASLTPPMSRTRSMPGVSGSGHLLISPNARPASPIESARVRLPRKSIDDVFPTSPVRTSVIDHDRSPSGCGPVLETTSSPNLSTGTFSRHVRRPSSPLRHPSSSSLSALPITPSSSIASSPNLRSYDSFSGYMASFPSSVPSTPTSTRSRSPSISSLETIPDSPDAEEAALEAERIAQLKAAAEAAEGGETKTRSGLDTTPSRGRTLGLSPRDKRKRWSVCGAERRGDLDLETIWED